MKSNGDVSLENCHNFHMHCINSKTTPFGGVCFYSVRSAIKFTQISIKYYPQISIKYYLTTYATQRTLDFSFCSMGRPHFRLGLHEYAKVHTWATRPLKRFPARYFCKLASIILHAMSRSPTLHIARRRLRQSKRTRKLTGRWPTSPCEGASAGFDALAIRSNQIFKSLEISNSLSLTSKACSRGELELPFIRVREKD